MALYRLPLLVLIALVPLGPLLSTASASHNQLSPEPTTARRHHHHPSPASTATVHFHPVPSATPSVHQNHFGMEQSQPMLALDRFTVEAQASSAEEDMAAAHPALLVPPQAAPLPPPLIAGPDLTSQAPPQHHDGSEGSASSTAAPHFTEPAAATTALLPLPNQRTAAAAASRPPPIQAGVARVSASDGEEGLLRLERVLMALGYHEMASAAPLLVNSPPLESWHGAITVFAAPDNFLHASCPVCSRRRLLLEHIALGYHPYSELTATHTVKIPSASIDLCLNLATERSPFSIHYDARLFVEGVEVSHPEVYNDGRYVVHGLHGFVRPHSLSPCFDDSHSLQCDGHVPTRSAATSVSMSTARVRIRIREAIARLCDGGLPRACHGDSSRQSYGCRDE